MQITYQCFALGRTLLAFSFKFSISRHCSQNQIANEFFLKTNHFKNSKKSFHFKTHCFILFLFDTFLFTLTPFLISNDVVIWVSKYYLKALREPFSSFFFITQTIIVSYWTQIQYNLHRYIICIKSWFVYMY